jgi:hypothetical protein
MLPPSHPTNGWRGGFERHARLVTAALFAAAVLIALVCTELLLRWYGAGNPVLYETSPLYGFRPLPNQTTRRWDGNVIHINNLGLRANADWDSTVDNKVLFLGNSVTFGGSYVSNDDLFSERVTAGNPRWVPGDGGVNGWGVENVYGLVADAHFHRARVYVTVLIEDDFYRGFRHKAPILRESKPRFAIQVLLPTVIDRIRDRLHHGDAPDTTGLDSLVMRAAQRLVSLDSIIRQSGAIHLIYISPALTSGHDLAPPDARVAAALAKTRLAYWLIGDRPQVRALKKEELVRLFHDEVHLSKAGQHLWATIIRSDFDSAVASAPKR